MYMHICDFESIINLSTLHLPVSNCITTAQHIDKLIDMSLLSVFDPPCCRVSLIP